MTLQPFRSNEQRGAIVQESGPDGRTILRYPGPDDREEFLALRAASADFHRPWEPAPAAGIDPYSAEAFANYLKGSRHETRERLLLCRRDSGTILGSFNLSEICRGPLQSAYLGYWIGTEFTQQGYMTEGIRLILRHAFVTLGLHRVEANIRPENEPSLALVRRAGFRREGFSPGYLKIDGAWRDHERWAMLADEFEG